MNVLVFEDEQHTAIHLIKLLTDIDRTINILAVIDNVKDGIAWYKKNKHPDLIFQDIILSDGSCFEIFDEVSITTPVIFTTAYSEYALQSFQVNNIDYLIKPYDIIAVRKSLLKYNTIKSSFKLPERSVLREILNNTSVTSKKRFLVKIGDRFLYIKSEEIAYFISEAGITFATLFNGKSHIVDYSILELSKLMDQECFFQINRKMTINIDSVKNINTWFNNRLKIELVPITKQDIIISRERVKNFKDWLDR